VDNEALVALARRQGGVFARWQALDLGFSHFMIARRLETKQWRRVLGNVLAAATTVPDQQSTEWAAYLACGRGAVLSGPSALRRHGLDGGERLDGVHWVTIPPERHVRIPSVRSIREAVPLEDIVLVDDMQVTNVARAVVDTLRVVAEPIGQPILDRALLRSWLTLEELELRTHALASRRGVGRLRKHLTRVRGGARSEGERRLHEIIADVPGWVADYKVFDSDGLLMAVIDVAFAEARVALEVDGLAFHVDPEHFQRDRTRQNSLVNQGWTVLRFTWDDLTRRPGAVLETIRTTLARQDPTLRSGFRVSSEI
jgi:very-short-patch-repair endonuclease